MFVTYSEMHAMLTPSFTLYSSVLLFFWIL